MTKSVNPAIPLQSMATSTVLTDDHGVGTQVTKASGQYKSRVVGQLGGISYPV